MATPTVNEVRDGLIDIIDEVLYSHLGRMDTRNPRSIRDEITRRIGTTGGVGSMPVGDFFSRGEWRRLPSLELKNIPPKILFAAYKQLAEEVVSPSAIARPVLLSGLTPQITEEIATCLLQLADREAKHLPKEEREKWFGEDPTATRAWGRSPLPAERDALWERVGALCGAPTTAEETRTNAEKTRIEWILENPAEALGYDPTSPTTSKRKLANDVDNLIAGYGSEKTVGALTKLFEDVTKGEGKYQEFKDIDKQGISDDEKKRLKEEQAELAFYLLFLADKSANSTFLTQAEKDAWNKKRGEMWKTLTGLGIEKTSFFKFLAEGLGVDAKELSAHGFPALNLASYAFFYSLTKRIVKSGADRKRRREGAEELFKNRQQSPTAAPAPTAGGTTATPPPGGFPHPNTQQYGWGGPTWSQHPNLPPPGGHPGL